MTTHRTYLFCLVDGGGTAPPELGTARRLVERGHRVVVLGEDSMEQDVLATGAEMRRWETAPNRPDRSAEHDPYRDWELKNPLQLFARIIDVQVTGPAPRYATDTLAAIEDVRPDLVVSSSFAFGSMIAAESAGILYDVLMPNPYIVPTPGIPPFGTGFAQATGVAGRLRDRAVNAVMARLWRRALPGLQSLRASLGLGPISSVFDQLLRARRVLVLTSPAFDFMSPAIPPNVHHVGAVLDDPAWAGAGESWTPPAGSDPLVLVALSSTFQDHVGCLQRIADGLGGLPVRALVTTGPAVDPSLVDAPANVTVVASAPHSAVLRSAAAVVTHGGHGTVVRSLAAGVPMLVLPHGRDQGDNAVRVTARGAGLQLKRTASAAAIAGAVKRLLDEPSFRASAAALGEAIRRDAGSGALVELLEDLPVTSQHHFS